jgi:hypothetical protein
MSYLKNIHKIEENSLDMAKKWAHGVMNSEYTQTYSKLPENKLIQLSKNVYDNLGKWMEDENSREQIEKVYSTIGIERYQQGYPLCEIIFALHFTKKILTNQIYSEGLLPDAMNLYRTMDFLVRIYDFFDFAAFFVAKGFQHAMRLKMMKTKKLDTAEIDKLFPITSSIRSVNLEQENLEKILDGFNVFKLK